MIKMLKYHGYEDDGVEGYQCLNCYSHISVRHHQFSCQILYCPFCGCKFEGAFIKNNKYKFYRKNKNGYFHSQLYKMPEWHYIWEIEKLSTTYLDFNHNVIQNENWEHVYTYNFSYDTTKSNRENILLQMRQDMKNEMEEKISFGDKEVIEYRLKYFKYYRNQPENNCEENITYYYPKNNKIIKIKRKAS